jgi:hypothetical protein
VHIREAFETLRQSGAYRRRANEAGTPRLGAPWRFQHAVIDEERHDAIEVVCVEGVQQFF